MKKILLLSLVLIQAVSHAQKRTSIKIYQNTDIFQTVVDERWKNQTTKVDVRNFSRVSVALNFKGRLEHELELFIPEISRPIEDLRIPMNYEIRKDPRIVGEGSSLAFRYEVSKTISKTKKALKFNFGAGINPYFVQIEYEPSAMNAYPAETELFGASIFVTPRITYNITDRFSIDLNIPLKVFDYRWEREQIHNPAIPIHQQINEVAKSIFFEKAYTIRLGVAYGLGSRDRR